MYATWFFFVSLFSVLSLPACFHQMPLGTVSQSKFFPPFFSRPLLRFFLSFWQLVTAGWSPLAGHRWSQLVTVASAARFTSRSALTTRTRRTKGARSQRSGCCCCCCCRRRCCCCRCPLPACLGGRRRRRPPPRTPAKKRMSQRPASQAPPAARSDLISNKKYLPQLFSNFYTNK